MKLTVTSIEWEGTTQTKYGEKYNWKVIAADEHNTEYAFTVWKSNLCSSVQVGDVLEGTIGNYNDTYGTYAFSLAAKLGDTTKVAKKVIPHTAPAKKTPSPSTAASDKDKRITLLSLLSSGVNLEAKKKEPNIGAVCQFVKQGESMIYKGEYILFCTPEQRKALVVKYGSVSKAEDLAYELYKKPYLHLLTHEEAVEMMSTGDEEA